MLSAPVATSARTSGASFNRRTVLATVDRSLPTRVGDLVVGEMELGGQPVIGRGFLDRIEILPLQVLHQRPLEQLNVVPLGRLSFTTTGTRVSPARCAARQRRSPAMIW